jgi:hypothetical protein
MSNVRIGREFDEGLEDERKYHGMNGALKAVSPLE